MKVSLKIKHVDGSTNVIAKGIIPTHGENVNLEYRFEGMTYGYTITKTELLKQKDKLKQ